MIAPFISIIVPVYKVEKYLDTCVKSIIQQTYKDFELILVDDGSPDNCPSLCDRYAEIYENIHVIHKKNGGLSDARNAGVNKARGKYVTFVDSDDFIHPLYLEMLVKGIQKTKADFSVVDLKVIHKENFKPDIIHKDSIEIKNYTAINALSIMLYQKFHDVSASGILLPRHMAESIPFPKGKRLEDLLTTYKFFLASKNITFVYAPLYYYLQRSGSIMKDRDNKMFLDWIDASNQIVIGCKKNQIIQRAAINKRFCNLRSIVLLLNKNFKTTYQKEYKNVLYILQNDRTEILQDPRATWQNKMAAHALTFGLPGLRVLYAMNKIRKLKNILQENLL